MPRKKPKLDHPVSLTNVGILPREILCIIFSYLDKKSVKSASGSCKLWLELIRNDSNLSSHVFLKYDGLKELQTKIEKSEWVWNRWPVLKVLELGHLSVNIDEARLIQEALDYVKSINFKDSSTLEKVICSANFDLEDIFPDVCSELRIATIEKLTFNPKHVNESFGMEQISLLHINLDSNMPLLHCSRFRRFNQNMLKYLNDSIQSVQLTVEYVTMIHKISNVCDFVTDLSVKHLDGNLFRISYLFIIPIFQQFKRLKKCQVNVNLWSFEEWHYFGIQGQIIVNEKFLDMTEVKFVFMNCFDPVTSQGSDLIFEALEVTKMPFEKSISKLIEVHSSPITKAKFI
jgi:hypothetical protein